MPQEIAFEKLRHTNQGYYLNHRPYSGEVKSYYANGKYKVLAQLIKGKENGECKTYYKNGQLKSSGIFQEGKPLGYHTGWNEAGEEIWSLYFSETHKLEKRIDMWEGPFPPDTLILLDRVAEHLSGNNQSTVFFYGFVPFSGFLIEKDRKPQVVKKVHYQLGLKHGWYQFFGKTEDIILREGRYEWNEKQGPWMLNNYLGQPKIMETYQNGVADGPYYHWYNYSHPEAENNLHYEYNYVNGKAEGPRMEYYQDGSLASVSHFVGGQMHGIEKRWDKQGRKTEEIFWKNGKMDGPYHSWHSSGTRKRIGHYRDHRHDSVWQHWYPFGEFYSKDIYKNGELIRKEKKPIFRAEWSGERNVFLFQEFAVFHESQAFWYRAQHDFSKQTSPDSFYFEVELGEDLQSTPFQLAGLDRPIVKVESQMEYCYSLSFEGPHLDLRDWKVGRTGWKELKQDAKGNFQLPSPSPGHEPIPYTDQDFLEEVKKYGGDESWLRFAREYDYLGWGVSRLYLRFSYRNATGKAEEKILVFTIPMGC